MRIIEPSFEILNQPDPQALLGLVELAGRTCYKSEDRIKQGTAPNFVRRIIASGHHSVIEHAHLTVRFICDRGVSHELVRHRLASYSQESTRYANYSQDKFGSEITLIRPFFWETDSAAYAKWQAAMQAAEDAYLDLLKLGARPQEARSVLPNSLKTEVVMTTNLREWRHVLGLRCDRASHPQIRQVMLPLLRELARLIPVFFDDLREHFQEDLARLA
ncbi:MAG: FAD-dependent thymidylate synthase [Deltaproteobacteria bacterium]|nr:FAD-dependent thymidylate synthase [Deltaproteobacteria bacterium]